MVILVDLDDFELLLLRFVFVLLTILPDLPNIGWRITKDMLLPWSSYGIEMDIEIEDVVCDDKSNVNDESIVDDDDLDDLELYCCVVVVAFPALNILPALLNKKNGWYGGEGGGGTLLLFNTSSTLTAVTL